MTRTIKQVYSISIANTTLESVIKRIETKDSLKRDLELRMLPFNCVKIKISPIIYFTQIEIIEKRKHPSNAKINNLNDLF